MVPVHGGVAFLQLPIHKGRLCPGNTAHLGLGGRGCCEHSATVKAGQTRLCPPWPRCRRKRGPAEVLMGLLPALPKPAPRVLIPSPPNACFRSRPGTPPPRPWPQLCPALTNIPLSLLSVWLFRVPSLQVVGNRGAGPQSRGQAWGGGETGIPPQVDKGQAGKSAGRARCQLCPQGDRWGKPRRPLKGSAPAQVMAGSHCKKAGRGTCGFVFVLK